MAQLALAQLPREIRDRIYDLAFIHTDIRPRKAPPLMPPLLLVNRQISAEAAVSFYNNRVCIGLPHELLSFLETIGNSRNLIKAVDMLSTESIGGIMLMPQLFQLLSSLSGLRSVAITMAEPSLTAAQMQLEEWGLSSLKGQAEIIVYNAHFQSHGTIDDNVADGWTMSIWKRAAGSINWVTDREVLRDWPDWSFKD